MAAWAYCSASCPGVADTSDQAFVHPDNAPGHCGQLFDQIYLKFKEKCLYYTGTFIKDFFSQGAVI